MKNRPPNDFFIPKWMECKGKGAMVLVDVDGTLHIHIRTFSYFTYFFLYPKEGVLQCI